jgi:hypothetical protein
MKAYRDAQGYREIPVGYSAADILQLRPMLQDYLTCGGNSSETVDFFALNSYSWCDPSTYKESTYDQLEAYAKKFPVPIFLSETGCIVPGPRQFDDQDAIFGPEMVNDWSGAIIYEWIQEENGYGIITYAPAGQAAGPNVEGGFLRKGTPTPKLPDFTALKSKWATNTPTGVSRDDYDAKDVSTRACPSSTAGGWWQVDGDAKLPTLGQILAVKTETVSVATETGTSTAESTADSTSGDSTGAATTSTPKSSSSTTSSAESTETSNGSPLDKRVTAFGAGLVGVVLGAAVLL